MATAAKTGVPIAADTTQIARIARGLRLAAPEAWKACRTSLRAIGQVVAEDAKARSGAFSTRIPKSIKVRVTTGGNVKVSAGGAQAPHAAALEHKGVPGTFRHPVYGNREVWVSQEARPFLAPALLAHQEQAVRGLEEAVYLAVERALKL